MNQKKLIAEGAEVAEGKRPKKGFLQPSASSASSAVQSMVDIPVIAIDGPSASGKGTIAQAVAKKLGFHYLDSGSLYRLVALAAVKEATKLDDEAALARRALHLHVTFEGGEIFLFGQKVTEAIRSEECGIGASRVAALPAVRAALLSRQRAFRQPPGLVAEGRDMTTVVFPDATLKIFLTASAEIRAERRYKQLKEKGINANIRTLLQELHERDQRDSARSVAPLQKAADARELDSTGLGIEEIVRQVLDWYRQKVAGSQTL
jgi:cytidylate kinase